MPFAPLVHLGQRCGCPGRSGMKKIAQDDQSLTVMRGQQGIQPGKCGLGGAAGHRLMKGAVAGGLADVHVCHQQGAAGGPVDGLVGEQPERLTTVLDGLMIHCSAESIDAALSRSATIRAIRSASFSVLSVSRMPSTSKANANGPGRFNVRRSSCRLLIFSNC
ncbi:hypothetical protein D3C80_1566940 [compost metagenome]